MHSTGTGQLVETQDVFFWRLAGWSAPTGLAIVHWIGCINAIKMIFGKSRQYTLQILRVKNFLEIALSLSVSEINAFLHFQR